MMVWDGLANPHAISRVKCHAKQPKDSWYRDDWFVNRASEGSRSFHRRNILDYFLMRLKKAQLSCGREVNSWEGKGELKLENMIPILRLLLFLEPKSGCSNLLTHRTLHSPKILPTFLTEVSSLEYLRNYSRKAFPTLWLSYAWLFYRFSYRIELKK